MVQCQLDIVPIKNENGNVVFFLVSVKDVSKDGGLGGSSGSDTHTGLESHKQVYFVDIDPESSPSIR